MFKILGKSLHPNNLRRYSAKPAFKKKVVAARKRAESIPALIQCKRSEFNLYESLPAHCKFGTIPLASSAWLHRKSKGDWFHINTTVNMNDNPQKMQDIQEYLQKTELTFDEKFIKNLKTEFDIKAVTNIQSQGWPKLCEGYHTLIAAETGCGKTICYLLPILQKIIEEKPKISSQRKLNSPIAIVLTPGRELASQIGSVIEKLSDGLDIRVKTILGGNTKRLLVDPDFEDIDIVVASVGALSKLVTTGIYRMDYVRHVILDEADTLLDDSFSGKLGHFLTRFPFHKNVLQSKTENGTQLIFVSATMPTNLNEILRKVVDVDTVHQVVSPDLHKLMPHVNQRFLRVNKSDRPAHLLTIIKKELSLKHPVIIFSNKTPTSDYVSIFLRNNGIHCLNLNGDMLRKIRLGMFEQFQNGECDFLSTTDVGSRGLDTKRARHVINFDFPLHISDYIHRSGRIGRVGSMEKCLVTNLISSRREIDIVQRIEHAARCGGLLPDVNANIKNLINQKIIKEMKESGIELPEDIPEELF